MEQGKNMGSNLLTKISDLQADNDVSHCELVDLLFLANVPPRIGMLGLNVKLSIKLFSINNMYMT